MVSADFTWFLYLCFPTAVWAYLLQLYGNFGLSLTVELYGQARVGEPVLKVTGRVVETDIRRSVPRPFSTKVGHWPIIIPYRAGHIHFTQLQLL